MNPEQQKAVFLDRDGVINRAPVKDGKPYSPASIEELEILPGVPEALTKLKEAGFLLICVTNQPDVARGRQNRDTVEAIHKLLLDELQLDEIIVCYHDDADRCRCRKPLPGMLEDAARRYSIDLAKSFMVGDRWRDVEAGIAAGCRTFFIDYGYDEQQPQSGAVMVSSLYEAVQIILRGAESEKNR